MRRTEPRAKDRSDAAACCPAKAAIDQRRLLSLDEASTLEDLFKVLANDTRLRLLHALTLKGELCVMDLAEALEMKPQAVSNQLQRLSDRRILGSRRSGNNIFYRVIDPCVTTLLGQGLSLVGTAEGA